MTLLPSPQPLPHILSLGFGVQSSTLMLMAAHGEVEPMPVCAIGADTGDETESTYTWLRYLQSLKLPFPLLIRSKGKLSDVTTLLRLSRKSGNFYTKPSIPHFLKDDEGKMSRVSRQCTADFKITVVQQTIKEFLGVKRAPKTLAAELWLGISYDELERMKDSRVPWLRNCYPLVDMKMTRADCLDWLKAHNYPLPSRSACYYCPFHSDTEWTRLRTEEPEEFEKAVAFDKRLREIRRGIPNVALKGVPYLHRSGLPLDEVILKPAGKSSGFEEECEGHCGL